MHSWIETKKEENLYNTTTHYRCLDCGCLKKKVIKFPKETLFNFYRLAPNDFKETKRIPKCSSILRVKIAALSFINIKTNETVFSISNLNK